MYKATIVVNDTIQNILVPYWSDLFFKFYLG